MNIDFLNAIRENILNTEVGIIASNRCDLVAICDELDARLASVEPPEGIDWQVVYGLGVGVRNAPEGVIYNERLHLLKLLEALDLAADAIAAKKPAKLVEVPKSE